MRCYLLILFFLVIVPWQTHAEIPAADHQESTNYKVAIFNDPPFVIMEGDQYSGIAVDLWELLATALKIDYTYYPIQTEDPLEALKTLDEKNYDILLGGITPVIETYKNKVITDQLTYSRPFFVDTIGVLEKKSIQSTIWTAVKFFAISVGGWILVLGGVFALYTGVLWRFERERLHETATQDELPKELIKGIKFLLWQQLAKGRVGVPITTWGKIALLGWIVGSYILMLALSSSVISVMTASIREYQGKYTHVSDLDKVRVVAVTDQYNTMIAEQMGVRMAKVKTFEEGVAAVEAETADAMIITTAHVDYYLRKYGAGDLALAPLTLKYLLYTFSYPKDSTLKFLVDDALTEFHMNGTALEICKKYLIQHQKGCL